MKLSPDYSFGDRTFGLSDICPRRQFEIVPGWAKERLSLFLQFRLALSDLDKICLIISECWWVFYDF